MKAGGNTLVGDRRLLMTRPRSQQRSRIRTRRILIVEDDLVIALMMEEIVREMGCAVSGIAGTLGMARLQFAKRDFDAVLLDVNLGGEYNPETAPLAREWRPIRLRDGLRLRCRASAREGSPIAEAILIHSAAGSR
jgi:CheY-like chemotaxis protein